MTTLDRNSSIPLHYQLKDILEQMILMGPYKAGKAFPTERELEERFHVSRTTIRDAIRDLVQAGYLTRQQGKGTFVARSQQAFDAARLSSFTEDMAHRGLKAGAKVLELSQEKPSGKAAQHFGLGIKTVWRIYRLRLANNEPIALQTSFLPADRFRFSKEQLENASLYEILASNYGVFTASADEIITASLAASEEAAQLGIKEKSALLCVHRSAFAQTGEPVEYVNIAYRADCYQFYVHQHRGS